MKSIRIAVLVLIAIFATAGTVFAAVTNWRAHLSGAHEVPARETPADGRAQLQIRPSGHEIRYQLKVTDIENVVAAHIHLGPPGTNGPVVAFLYGPVDPGGGPEHGWIAKGVITAADLVGPLAGQPLSALVEQMRAGNTYVNVHTNDGISPTNTGPGDFPGGEIRGQIVLNGD